MAQESALANLTLCVDGTPTLEVHSAIVCFGERGSTLMKERAEAAALAGRRGPSGRVEIEVGDALPADEEDRAGTLHLVLLFVYGNELDELQTERLVMRGGRVTAVPIDPDIGLLLRLHSAAENLGVGALVNLTMSILLGLSRRQLGLCSDPMHVFAAVNKIIGDSRNDLQFLLDNYLEAKAGSLTSAQEAEVKSHLKTGGAAVLMKKQKAKASRGRRVRRVSMLIAKRRSFEMQVAVPEAVNEGEEEEEEDEAEDEAQPAAAAAPGFAAAATKTIVLAGFDAASVAGNPACISVRKGDTVTVLLYDPASGWAGILTEDGRKGYIPTHSLPH